MGPPPRHLRALLAEACSLIRWDMRRTFCFYCWRKKIVLILISSGSAGSCFSRRKMLEEKFSSAQLLCAQLLCAECSSLLHLEMFSNNSLCSPRQQQYQNCGRDGAAAAKQGRCEKTCKLCQETAEDISGCVCLLTLCGVSTLSCHLLWCSVVRNRYKEKFLLWTGTTVCLPTPPPTAI